MAAYLVDLLLRDSIPTKERYTTMETTNIVDFARRDGMTDALTELLKTRAQHLIATAVQALEGFLAQFSTERPRQAMRLWCETGIIRRARSKRALALLWFTY